MSHSSTQVRKWERRRRRANRVRKRTKGTSDRPRLSVYRSHRHFHCQIINDETGQTIIAASTQQKGVEVKNGGDVSAAKLVGTKIAEAAKEKGILKVVFDRNFYKFHGRVKAFAEAASAQGLQFLTNPNKKKREKPKKEKGKKGQKGGGDEKAKKKKDKKPKKEKKG